MGIYKNEIKPSWEVDDIPESFKYDTVGTESIIDFEKKLKITDEDLKKRFKEIDEYIDVLAELEIKEKQKQILEELKKLNKHLDNIEAKEIGEMIYNSLGARQPMSEERIITWEELKELAGKGLN